MRSAFLFSSEKKSQIWLLKIKEKNNCLEFTHVWYHNSLIIVISYFRLRQYIAGLAFLYITNVSFYNLQSVPFKNKLKYKCCLFGRGNWLVCRELQTMPILFIRIRLYGSHKYCILKRNVETVCAMNIVKSIIKHNKT